jgi:transcriptional regulatory protein LevR
MGSHAPATHNLPARAMPQHGSNHAATACHSASRLHRFMLYTTVTGDGHAELLKNLVEEEVDKHPHPPLIYLFFHSLVSHLRTQMLAPLTMNFLMGAALNLAASAAN